MINRWINLNVNANYTQYNIKCVEFACPLAFILELLNLIWALNKLIFKI